MITRDKKYKVKKCITCGKLFMPKQERSLCCSKSCSKKAYNTLLIQQIMEEAEIEKIEHKKKTELFKMKEKVMKYINKSKDLRELSFKSDVGLSILESVKMGVYGITDKIVERCYKVLQELK